MAGQFCSSALQKLDRPGGAPMSNFPGRLRRRSGVAAPGCPGKAESSISRCRSDFLRQRPTNTPPTMPRRRRPDQRRSAHHQREPLPRYERAGQRLQLQDPDTPAQPPFGPQVEPTLTVGGQPIKRQSAVYRATKRFVEKHLDCRHLEVGDEHPLDMGATHGCRRWRSWENCFPDPNS
jgi:hypothetical protein